MTIAAGFLCRDGVLLCADTEHTGWAAKSHHSKVDHFEIQGGKVCFALAGSAAFARSAIEKCKKHLKAGLSADPIGEIEQILDSEYRRNVLSHPDFANLDYSLLLAIWTQSTGAKLYATTRTAINAVRDFQCLGVGAELAAYLIRPGFSSPCLRDAVSLATYALAGVKEGISGCGGMSIYLLLRSDGNTGVLTDLHDGPPKELETYSRVFDFMTRRLLLMMANTESEEVHFEQNLHTLFVQEILAKRREWSQRRNAKENEFASRNPHLTQAQVKQMFDDWMMGFGPLPK